MKTFKLFSVLAILGCLSSCQSTPIIGADNAPFVVCEIKDVGGNLSCYYGGYESSLNHALFTRKPTIVLPTGYYNIGDTIVIYTKR